MGTGAEKCKWCGKEALHYLGGGLWVCWEHFLKTVR
jgi:hypothetical protein